MSSSIEEDTVASIPQVSRQGLQASNCGDLSLRARVQNKLGKMCITDDSANPVTTALGVALSRSDQCKSRHNSDKTLAKASNVG